MSERRFDTISGAELEQRLARTGPDNESRSRGFALVNVLDSEQFERERIPGSANIPQGEEGAFEKRFASEKEIIVYCASPQCEASERVANELSRRGFTRVVDYQAGLSEWRDAGRPVAGSGA